ncbi:hypothetical protein MN608_08325 [Microdochium nivale]|nr:hypothetical protein MN608_08325 [Microdochium nivale]
MPSLLDLPGEIRNDIYQLVLSRDEPLNVAGYSSVFMGPQMSTALLRTNKQVHNEASAILYGQNTFDARGKLVSFLDQIGRANAASIARLMISFPTIIRYLPGDIWYIDESDVGMLVQMQECCTSLHTLTAYIHFDMVTEDALSSLYDPAVARGILGLVDKRLRAISSLQHVILIIDEGPSEEFREEAEQLGWTVEIKESEHFEDDWRDQDAWGEEEYWHSEMSDDLYNDDYDIEYDSDFWRRADD